MENESMDMSQYLGIFLDEGNEQLSLLEAEVLNMERGDHSTEILQRLFRAAHTLKGSSRAMGFMEIGNLTHEMENVLDDLRNDKLTVTGPIIDALLKCLDSLGALMGAVADSGTDTAAGRGQEIAELVARLNALRTGAEAPETPAETAPKPRFEVSTETKVALAAAAEAGLSIFKIEGSTVPDCMMRSVRVYMEFAALEGLGKLIASFPDSSVLDGDEFDGHFLAFLGVTAQTKEEIERTASEVSEISGVFVEAYHGEEETPVATHEKKAEKKSSKSQDVAAPTPEAPAAEAPKAGPEVAVAAVAQVPEKKESKPENAAPAQAQTIRVGVSRLDMLLNLVGELVTDRHQITRIVADLASRHGEDPGIAPLHEALGRVAVITTELQEQVMKTRMLPIDGVFQRMPRMMRDLAQKTGKEFEFVMSGGETELDRSVLEILGDPLIHILRNSADHGMEMPEDRVEAGKLRTGLISMNARYEESRIVIEVTDDGKGIDPAVLRQVAVKKGMMTEAAANALSDRDAINLIMASGFSTAKEVSDISGRGVGMDIVRSNIEKIGGRITVDSKVGVGTKIAVHLPLTLAIVRALLVKAEGQTYVIPLNSVVEMLRLGQSNAEFTRTTVAKQSVIVLRGETIPLVGLAGMLAGDPKATMAAGIKPDAHVVVVGHENRHVGICVDAVDGEQEVVIKSLGSLLGDIPGVSGGTILGDGKVALIIDTNKAIDDVRVSMRSSERKQDRKAVAA